MAASLISQIISTIGPAPSTADPDTFDSRADTLLASDLPDMVTELNQFKTEANALATQANVDASAASAAAVAVDSAAALANYDGQWADLTGAYSSGRAVSHDGGIWISTTAIADVTASEPTLSNTDWEIHSLRVGLLATDTAAPVTLTSASTAVQNITPTDFGQSVALPDATTLVESTHNYIFKNATKFSAPVHDYDGDLLGFVGPYQEAAVCLADSSASAGVWTVDDLEPVHAVAELFDSANYAPAEMGQRISDSFAGVDMGGGRILTFLSNTSNHLYCVVYNRLTNVVSSLVAVRAAAIAAEAYSAIRVADGQVLVCSTTSTTAFEAVLITLSGDTPVVNTAATATLSANFVDFSSLSHPIVATGTGEYVVQYAVTSQWQIRSMTISGTTVTIGSATNLSGTVTTTGAGIVSNGAGKVITSSVVTTTVHVEPFTISGTTITLGTKATQASWDATSSTGFFVPFGSYWLLVEAGAAPTALIVTLTSTTVTLNSTALGLSGALDSHIQISSTKWLFVENTTTTAKLTILTNSSGTGSAGTLTITTVISGVWQIMQIVSDTVYLVNHSTSGVSELVELDVSGATPVAVRSQARDADTASHVPVAWFNYWYGLRPDWLKVGSKMVFLGQSNTMANVNVIFQPGNFRPFACTSPRGLKAYMILSSDGLARLTDMVIVSTDDDAAINYSAYLVEAAK